MNGLTPTRRLPPPLLVALAAILVALAVNHAGYRGGGADDWQYLQAARCAVAQHGLCVPDSHWWARFPLVAPMAAAIALGGESRLAIGLAPLLYAVAAILLATLLVRRRFGRAEAIIAGLLLATLPAIGLVLLQPNVDTAELAFDLAALFALDSAARTGRRRFALIAGILLGLAVLTRPSALALVPIAALLLLATPSLRRFAVPALLGLALPLLAEMAVYQLWLGDPLHSWALSLGHTNIPTAELPPDFHSSRGPLFNPDYIAAWRPSMGIHVHWTLDPLLNLIANPAIGPLLAGALLLLALRRPALRDAESRSLAWLVLGAILYFGAITYAFGIDPKPRMFLPVAAAAAAIFAVQAAALWREGRRAVPAVLTVLLLGLGLFDLWVTPDLSPFEPTAAAWTRSYGPGLAIGDASRRFLTLAPGVSALPVDPAHADRYMILAFGPCESTGRFAGWTVEQHETLATDGGETASLCLFRRPAGPAAAPRR